MSISTIESMAQEAISETSYSQAPSNEASPVGIGADPGSIASMAPPQDKQTTKRALASEKVKALKSGSSSLLTKEQKDDVDYMMRELTKATTSKLPGKLGRTSVLLSMYNGSLQKIVDSQPYKRIRALQRPFYVLDYVLNHKEHCKEFERIAKDYGKEIFDNQEREITEAYQALKNRQPYSEHIHTFCSKLPFEESKVLQKMESKQYHSLLLDIFKKKHELSKSSKR